MIKNTMIKHLWTSQKQPAMADAPVRMILKRKSGYNIAPMNRAKVPQTKDSQDMELDNDRKELALGDTLD